MYNINKSSSHVNFVVGNLWLSLHNPNGLTTNLFDFQLISLQLMKHFFSTLQEWN